MGKLAFVFPGQGAQTVGMGHDAFLASSAAKRIFDEADEALGFPLTDVIFNGPEEKLKLTYYTQPALLATSMALYESVREWAGEPDYVAGHSLGEYSALVASNALSFKDAVRTVEMRGRFMDEAVPAGIGGMAAVLGLDRDTLSSICQVVSAEIGIVEMANINCPGQIVVSGTAHGVQAILDRAKSAGARRVIPLEVSGPFHSSLMKQAAEKLRAVLAEVPMRDSSIPLIANVTAEPVQSAAHIRKLLVEQVYSSVLWEDSVRRLIAEGVDTFVEIGPGTVLAGLIRKIDKDVSVVSVNSLETAAAAKER